MTEPTVSDLTLSAALKLWREHGGSTFGPRVEHVSMKERDFLGFCKALVAQPQATTVGGESAPRDGRWLDLSTDLRPSVPARWGVGSLSEDGDEEGWVDASGFWALEEGEQVTGWSALIGIPGAEKGEAVTDDEISLTDAQPPQAILRRLNEYVEARLAVRNSRKQTYLAAEEQVRAAYAALRDEFRTPYAAPTSERIQALEDALHSIEKKARDLAADPMTSQRGLWVACADEAEAAALKATP